jgi:hypothetical protein
MNKDVKDFFNAKGELIKKCEVELLAKVKIFEEE